MERRRIKLAVNFMFVKFFYFLSSVNKEFFSVRGLIFLMIHSKLFSMHIYHPLFFSHAFEKGFVSQGSLKIKNTITELLATDKHL
jgi:hypothetical protein